MESDTVVGWFGDYAAAVSWGGPAAPDPLTSIWLANELNAVDHVYRSAESDAGEVVGFFGLYLLPPEARAHLRRFAAAPTHRR
jgi:hypothetical protein